MTRIRVIEAKDGHIGGSQTVSGGIVRKSLKALVLLVSTSSFAGPAIAQDAAVPPDENSRAAQAPGSVSDGLNGTGEDDEIVVSGQRPRGSVIGDAQPEITFNGGDIRAMGVGSISELVSELGSQLASARGGQPVVLLEGRRISSFREISSIPSEAIQRAEVLPEDVALKYGYSANQKVLNIVLRQRFRAITVESRNRITTEWDNNQFKAELGFLTIRRDDRVNINAEYEIGDMLKESDRGILTDAGTDTGRSLRAGTEKMTINGTYAHTFSNKVSSSLNAEVVSNEARSLIGLSSAQDGDVFTRDANDLSLHLGGTLNAVLGRWNSTLTGNYNRDEGRTISVRGTPAELARTWKDAAELDFVVNGNLLRLPAGDVSLTTHLGGTIDGFRSESRSLTVTPGADLDRRTGFGSASIDVPVFEKIAAFPGRLSVNGNAELRSLSDFGSVTSYGYGLHWTPVRAINVSASFAQSQSAPSMQQLGNPRIVTPLVPVFDFTTGESVLVSRISGGNPDLFKAESRQWNLGLTVKPLREQDLTLTASYSRSRTKNGVGSLSGLSAETQAAFPDRYVRDGEGNLISIDATPINIASQKSSQLRWGFNFSKRLATPQSEVDAMRAAFQRRMAERQASGQGGPGQGGSGGGEGGPRRFGAGPGGPGGPPGGFGGRGPGGGGGRLTLSVYHTWRFEDSVRLHSSLPEIDLLNGGSLGGGPASPQHQVELQAGASRSGLGFRLTGKWQSAMTVGTSASSPAETLRFGSLTTFNLRIFANPSQIPGLIGKHEWLRGTRISLTVDNLFDERQKVRNGLGETPYAYLPAFRDPVGRTVSIFLRKQFF
ncbi:MAG: TonB-dependent receptor [Novosphingobium sp.]|nr:TonB-dependent receptor [Novosphingobium sp.]